MTETVAVKVPHVFPYQGSKRKLAKDILGQITFNVDNFYEPFAGSAAVSLAAATQNLARHYVISDKLKPLTDLWIEIIKNPNKLVNEYEQLWQAQLTEPNSYYNAVRDEFNDTPTPAAFLYLVARCVKNSIRFNVDGKFNQSPDNRRLGVKPSRLALEVLAASNLLRNRVTIQTADFQDVIRNASPNDVIYMDHRGKGQAASGIPVMPTCSTLINSLTHLGRSTSEISLIF